MTRFSKSSAARRGRYTAMPQAQGTFAIAMTPEPPYDSVEGVDLARVVFDKQFEGPLTATSKLHMIGVRGPVKDSRDTSPSSA